MGIVSALINMQYQNYHAIPCPVQCRLHSAAVLVSQGHTLLRIGQSGANSPALECTRFVREDHERTSAQLGVVCGAVDPGALSALRWWLAAAAGGPSASPSVPSVEPTEPTARDASAAPSLLERPRQFRLACKGVNLHLAGDAGASAPAHGLWLATEDVSGTLVTGPAAAEGRPWLSRSARWTQADASVLGLTLAVTARAADAGAAETKSTAWSPPAGHAIEALCLAPFDVHVEAVRLDPGQGALSTSAGQVLVRDFRFLVSQDRVAAVTSVLRAFRRVGEQETRALPDKAPPASSPEVDAQDDYPDDLVSGLFVLEAADAAELPPLGIRMWGEPPSSGAGEARQYLQWRYPRPRAVRALVFRALVRPGVGLERHVYRLYA